MVVIVNVAAIAAGLSDPNFSRDAGAPATSVIVNVPATAPVRAVTCASPGVWPGVYVVAACPSASVTTVVSLSVPPPSTMLQVTFPYD